MPVMNLSDLLSHAARNRYAVGSFELYGLEFIHGIMDAAEQARAPVILGVNAAAADMPSLLAAAVCAARRTAVPAALCVHGASSVETVVRAVRHGCNGVGLDTSHMTMDENTSLTRATVATGRQCGIPTGGALVVDSAEDKGVRSVATQARQFVSHTGINFLTLKRGEHTDERKFASRVAAYLSKQVPLAVDEGCVDAPALTDLIQRGVAMIRCGTALSSAAVQRCAAGMAQWQGDYAALSQHVRHAVAGAVAQRLNTWGGTGQAADAMRHCRPHREVEHLIIYNANTSLSEGAVEDMMATGRQVLSPIPGVRRVFTGRAVQDQAGYRYCWLVRFAGAAVIDSYRDHPDHKRFADTLFRPIAEDRISIDYESVE